MAKTKKLQEYNMVIDGIKVEATPERHLTLANQVLACAFFEGVSWVGNKLNGSCGRNSYSDLETEIPKVKELCEGAVIVDCRHFTIDQAIVSVNGPSLGEIFPKGTGYKFFNIYKKFKKLPTDEKLKKDGILKLSLDLYVELKRRQGAKIGRWINGQIIWEKK